MLVNALAAIVFAAAPDGAANPLQPLDFLVGSCWSGDFPHAGGTDTHCFESVYGGKFVRDTHVVMSNKPDYNGESIYGWDPQQHRIVFWYWNSSGVIEHGTVEADSDGLNFPEHHLTQPEDVTYRTRWRRIDADHYAAANERKDGGAWKTDWKIEYRRVPK